MTADLKANSPLLLFASIHLTVLQVKKISFSEFWVLFLLQVFNRPSLNWENKKHIFAHSLISLTGAIYPITQIYLITQSLISLTSAMQYIQYQRTFYPPCFARITPTATIDSIHICNIDIIYTVPPSMWSDMFWHFLLSDKCTALTYGHYLFSTQLHSLIKCILNHHPSLSKIYLQKLSVVFLPPLTQFANFLPMLPEEKVEIVLVWFSQKCHQSQERSLWSDTFCIFWLLHCIGLTCVSEIQMRIHDTEIV